MSGPVDHTSSLLPELDPFLVVNPESTFLGMELV